MKIGIISDTHANLAALERVRDDMIDQKVDEVWCQGDTVGYGPDPWLCWQMIKNEIKAKIIIRGNHEEALISPNLMQQLTHSASEGVEHARRIMPEGMLQEIAALPLNFVLAEYSIALTHASFCDQWHYVRGQSEAWAELDAIKEQIGFIGHTHTPLFVSQNNGRIKKISGRFRLEPNDRYLINPGSVGQPRDGDNRASYGLLELNGRGKYFSWRKVEYPILETTKRITDAGLPDGLAKRLFRGQ